MAAHENNTNPHEMAVCIPDRLNNHEINTEPISTKKPTTKKPLKKLKSFLVTRAYAESPTKASAVVPRAEATIKSPFAKLR